MRHIFFIALLLCSFSTWAQVQETFKGEHFIEVTGTAETEFAPNEITFLIALREFEENKNKVQLEKLDQDFLMRLEKLHHVDDFNRSHIFDRPLRRRSSRVGNV